MISVKDAKNKLYKSVKKMPATIKNISDITGYFLSESIKSPVDLPPFDQSAMDGFAVNFDDTVGNMNNEFSFLIIGEIKAGDKPIKFLKKNTAVYIYTGAAVPINSTCVVMQEKAVVKKGSVTISLSDLKTVSNIRSKGSEIKKGQVALTKGHQINPASIGFLCSMGIDKIKVIDKPILSVLSTGNELQRPGKKLSPGKIYESNSLMLESVIKECGYEISKINSVKDVKDKISFCINNMIKTSDVILISGGISVGKYDLVKEILHNLGVREIFYKVLQKPGKPLYAGKYKDKLVFALPGNPAASLTCFYEYVLPCLNKMSGHSEFELNKKFFPLSKPYELKGEKDLFLKAKIENDMIAILEGQGSNILRSFTESNAIVFLNSGNKLLKKGSYVETHILPKSL
ncbi:MAG TPA: molybdopterin molybdotransferase MoeA [Ignavibacteria bacterium]|nr:molybdopterin molybdotransferase MoeA [Ignavibacteria bacterium]